ncbi:MAG: hypothetical protein IK104_10545, partial [Clostridia bacterium]|nr:hypothetical protein [Clostridia bacterium]
PQGMQFLRKTRRRGRINLTVIRPLQRSISQISAPLRLYYPLFAPPLVGRFFVFFEAFEKND